MIGPVSSQPNVASQQAAAPTKVQNAAPKAPPAPAPYNAMKEKLESASAEAKESSTTKASEAMHQLANAEASKVPASAVATNPVVTTQVATQAYQAATPPVA